MFKVGDRVRDKFRPRRVGDAPDIADGTIKEVDVDGTKAITIAWDRGSKTTWMHAQCSALLQHLDRPEDLKGGERVRMIATDPNMNARLQRHLDNTGIVECVVKRDHKKLPEALVKFERDFDPWWISVKHLEVVT